MYTKVFGTRSSPTDTTSSDKICSQRRTLIYAQYDCCAFVRAFHNLLNTQFANSLPSEDLRNIQQPTYNNILSQPPIIMSAEAIAQAEKLIPCDVRMFSGCRDEQTSADGASTKKNAKTFQLSDMCRILVAVAKQSWLCEWIRQKS
jgi:hypothetical protein